MKRLGSFLWTLLILIFSTLSFADEGMWLLDQIPQLNLQDKGLLIDDGSLWNPKDGGISSAVVSLGGCTASFVSENGLIITNHHCAYGAIQRNSSKDNNLLEKGFLAKSYEEELPTFGTNVYVLQSFEDVTDKVLKGVKKEMSPGERYKTIEKNITKIVQKAEKDPNISATVASMNYGMQYILYKSLKIKDVRLVYAPPQSIGKFGGDIDNFEWPRHTGDYSFLRAYVGPDGKPAEPSKDNVPYKPKKWLKVSTKGYQKGSYLMAIGYPGRTARYRTSYDIDFRLKFYYPWRINMLKKYIAVLDERSAEDPEVAIKLASWISMLNNSLKNSEGQYDGLRRTNLYQQKVELEKKFNEYLQQHPDKQKKYGDILPAIKKLYEELNTFEPKLYASQWLLRASSVVGTAYRVYKWSIEKEKPALERESGYQDKDIEQSKERMKFSYRNFDAETEKRALAFFFSLMHELPEGQKIATVEELSTGAEGEQKTSQEKAFIDRLYRGTKLTSLDERLKLFDATTEELEKLNDPAIAFAKKLYNEIEPLRDKSDEFDGAISKLRPRYIEALTEWQNKPLYPDANGTKRLTYGYVKGYSPRDAVWYKYFTTTKGILEKYTGKDPFDSPPALLDLIKSKDFGQFKDAVTDKMQVNFLTNLDTTGGNSGSPVLNAKGELIGLVFDGNYESIVADYIYDEPFTRTICVDIRYVLWLMQKLDGADNLLNELELQ